LKGEGLNRRDEADMETAQGKQTRGRKHSVRLRATADRLFSGGRQSGRYLGGWAQAETGSRMIEHGYRSWVRTGTPLEAARDPHLWQHAAALSKHGMTFADAASPTGRVRQRPATKN
jgi:hypothetical protein